jgi:putative endonuclease
MKNPTVYILASQRNGTLYIGVTSDLIKRIWQHKEELVEGFTKQHKIKMLVWYEQHATMESAISKEKAMKKWICGMKSTNKAFDRRPRERADTPRHSRAGGNPEGLHKTWIPASARMTV